MEVEEKEQQLGSGTTVPQINKFMDSFEVTQKMMKKMQGGKGMKKMMKNFKGLDCIDGLNPNDFKNMKF